MYDILKLINSEKLYQKSVINLIASENYVSDNILKALGSELTNKYAEGYTGKRYYTGCEYVDKIENTTIDLVKKIYNVEYANVQPYSGSIANMAVYSTFLNIGDKILSLGLDCGGHISHGLSINFSGDLYQNCYYKVNKRTECVDLNIVEDITKKEKPDLIICGASSYSQDWDYKNFREIADKYKCILMCDMAHTAGIIAKKKLNDPTKYCHIITSTTQKTLRGPRGGMILLPVDFYNNELKKYKNTDKVEKISTILNKKVFPYLQGGPHMNIIAAKGICFQEVINNNFDIYISDVLKNANTLCNLFIKNGYRVVSNSTKNHLFVVDLYDKGILGYDIEKKLESVGILCNRETIPFDEKNFNNCYGIRFGTPAITTAGFKEKDMYDIFYFIDTVIKNMNNSTTLSKIKNEISNFIKNKNNKN